MLELLTVAAAVVTLPYLSVAPGSAQGVDGLISVLRDKAFAPEGEVLLATVALQPVTPIEAVVGWLRPGRRRGARAAGDRHQRVRLGLEGAGDDLRVVKVVNLDEALAALADIGGDLTALGPAARGPQG